jgi:competence protein ComEA
MLPGPSRQRSDIMTPRAGMNRLGSPEQGGSDMARLWIALVAVLCSVSPLAIGNANAQSPTDLMKRMGDAQKLAGPLDLNSASLDDLKKLPGVGNADAQKIVDGRPFAKTSDLVDKNILSSDLFDKIKGFITVK